jgi:Prolyl oligopeptidase family.
MNKAPLVSTLLSRASTLLLAIFVSQSISSAALAQGYPQAYVHVPQAYAQVPQAYVRAPQAYVQVPQAYVQVPQFSQAPRAPQAAPYQIQEFAVNIGERSPLHGILTLPAGPEAVPCVVLVQGVGAHDKDYSVGPNKPFMQLAAGLAMQGVAVLRFDKRTFAYPECQADYNFDINEETLIDSVAAVDFVRNHPRIDSQRVFFCGHSMSGLLAPEMTKRVPELAGVIILSSPSRTLEAIVEEYDENKKARSIAQFSPRCWQQVKNIDASSEVFQLSKPVFVAQGGADEVVPLNKNLQRWQKSTASGNVSLALYPMNHALLQLPGEDASSAYRGLVPPQLVLDLTHWVNSVRREIAYGGN